MQILLIEDDAVLQDIFAFELGRHRYKVERANDGLTGLRLAESLKHDLILVDTTKTLPGTADVCKGLREEGVEAPILAMAKHPDDLEDVLSIQKPFQMQDLLLKIRTATWEKEYVEESVRELSFGRLVFEPEKLLVTKDGEPINLVAHEFDMVYHMAKEPGKVFSREDLLREVWGYAHIGDTRVVDVAIRRLREKLEDDPSHPEFVKTYRRRGYSFSGG